MKTAFNSLTWIPYAWIILQTYILISVTIFFLKKFKVLKRPISGIEYGLLVYAASVLFGVLVISTGSISAMFQATRIYLNDGQNVLEKVVTKFAQLFLILVAVVAVYILLVVFNSRLYFKEPKKNGSNESNLSKIILITAINLGLSVIFWFSFKELTEDIVPVFLNFR